MGASVVSERTADAGTRKRYAVRPSYHGRCRALCHDVNQPAANPDRNHNQLKVCCFATT